MCVLARRHICLRLAANWLRLIALREQLSGRSGKNMVSAVTSNRFAVIEFKQCQPEPPWGNLSELGANMAKLANLRPTCTWPNKCFALTGAQFSAMFDARFAQKFD